MSIPVQLEQVSVRYSPGSPPALSDITMEIGKSLGEQTYFSLQAVQFGAGNAASSGNALGQSNLITPDKGFRTGLEYQFNANRTFEAFYNYRVDDNLEPVPFDPQDLGQGHSYVLRMRNTIPTGNYGLAASRRRRYVGALDQNGNTLGALP